MKIKELIFEKFSGTFSYFIVGKIEGYKNIRYYVRGLCDGGGFGVQMFN